MHGHGVNLRHIGLLRALFLEEATRFWGDESEGRKEGEEVSGEEATSKSASVSACAGARPVDGDAAFEPHADSLSATAFLGVDPACDSVQGEREEDTGTVPLLAPISGPVTSPTRELTPSLDALQSELFLEALCRTLKSVLRDMQRGWMKSQRSSSGESFPHCYADDVANVASTIFIIVKVRVRVRVRVQRLSSVNVTTTIP